MKKRPIWCWIALILAILAATIQTLHLEFQRLIF